MMKKGTQDINKLLQQSYKKLKSSAYFDRTNPGLREQIVSFEKENGGQVDQALQALKDTLEGTDDIWNKFVGDHLARISAHCYPKSLADPSTSKKEEGKPVFISNVQGKNVCIEKFQYIADIPVEFHILGVLWLLLIGYKVDADIYDKLRRTMPSVA